MSQPGHTNNSTNDPPHAFSAALIANVVGEAVQPLVTQLQQVANQNAQIQNSLTALQGSGGGGGPQQAAPPGAHGSGRKKGSAVPRPDKTAEKLLQNVVRRVLTSGCKIEHFKDAQLGLTDEELQERIQNNPPNAPWRPDFLKLMRDSANKYWVDKIIADVMSDTKGLGFVESGKIGREFWTEECITQHILGPMWNNIRKEVKKLVDADAAARGMVNHSKGNRDGRSKRLYNARVKLATSTGTDNQPKFKYKLNGTMHPIPVELMVEEVMSDVFEEQYDSDHIPAEVGRDEYRNKRPLFGYEGRPPFFRRKEPWNGIFKSMDMITCNKSKGFGIQPRYYAGDTSRGQNTNVNPDMASKIPTSVLYRCHISKEWYARLSEAQLSVLKPSPPGWEVDEERAAATSMQA